MMLFDIDFPTDLVYTHLLSEVVAIVITKEELENVLDLELK